MKVFVTGVTGYIGGSLANRLIENGHEVFGLVRTEEKASLIKHLGIHPIIGTLDSRDVLIEAAKSTNATINTASSDHRGIVEVLVEALRGSEKPLIHTSGTSIIADDAQGEYESARIFHDDSALEPIPIRSARVEIDRFVRKSGIDAGVRSVVICPSMIYGTGLGLQKNSDQIPKLTEIANRTRSGRCVGRGLNRWSNVFIRDLLDLYLLALEKAPTGSFFFAENGEEPLWRVAEAISYSLGFGGTVSHWCIDDAIAEFGDWARFAIGSNSRVRAINARRLLGWNPAGPSLVEAVLEGAK
jgi:nucleoside-diphosphate-sugar epimerase